MVTSNQLTQYSGNSDYVHIDVEWLKQCESTTYKNTSNARNPVFVVFWSDHDDMNEKQAH